MSKLFGARSYENKDNLEAQAERLVHYCEAKGYQVHQLVKEVGSGVNDNRRKFLSLLGDPTITRIVVEHKDRSTRFGFRYLEVLLGLQGRSMEVVNLADEGREWKQEPDKFKGRPGLLRYKYTTDGRNELGISSK